MIKTGFPFLLLLFGVHLAQAQPDSLVTAAWKGNLNQVARFVSEGTELDKPNAYGLTPWQAAQLTGRRKMLDWMAGQEPDTLQSLPERSALADWLFSPLKEEGLPGAAALVGRGETVLFAQGYGLATVSPPEPVESQTVFRIGSLTKQFTAAAILKLAEEGKLKLEDTLSTWLPDFPGGNRITVHRLLNHTSGIHSYTEEADFLKAVRSPIEPQLLLEKIATYPPDFRPGAAWKYSNSGYFILGYLVERLSGKSYGSYLEDTFFKPLNMSQTGVYVNQKAPEGEAKGYVVAGEEVRPASNWDMSWTGGAGALYSTVNDLHRWNVALHEGKVLKEASYRKMISPYRFGDGKPATEGEGYGYGLMVGRFRGETIYSHTGGLEGFMSYLGYLPDRKATVVVLANAAPNENLIPRDKGLELLSAWFGENLGQQRTIGNPQLEEGRPMKAYTGLYEYPRGQILEVTESPDGLKAQLTGQQPLEIVPVALDSFQWLDVEASARFHRGNNGQVSALTHYQNGTHFDAPKFEFPEVVDMDTSAFDLLAGTYQLGAAELRVFRKGIEYFAQMSGQPPYPVYPASENKLFFKVVRASLRFEREEEEKPATAVTLLQGGTEQRAPRKE